MTRSAWIALFSLLSMTACGSMSEESHSLFADTMPGLSEFDTITKQDKKDAEWWDQFYGRPVSANGSDSSAQ